MRLLPSLRGVSVRARVAAQEPDGFVLDRQSGSHRVYFNPADHRRAVVPWKSPGSTLPYGTLKAILDDLGWSAEDLKRLRLI
jgi:predicted RNA binding protein YcfA (HicA-like mRNA interferase family)